MTRYVKFIDEVTIEDAPRNYVTEDGLTICNFNLDPDIMYEYGYKPLELGEREEDKQYTVTYREYKTKVKEILEEIIPDPDEEARKERERLDRLTLTPSDVERALYYGLGMDFDDLKALIAIKAPSVDVKAIGIEFRANDFYRGAKDRNGNRLVDMIGLLLGLTTSDLDYLFEYKELPAETSARVRPILMAMISPQPVVQEPVEEPSEEPTEEPVEEPTEPSPSDGDTEE